MKYNGHEKHEKSQKENRPEAQGMTASVWRLGFLRVFVFFVAILRC
jgi:hypothetical protein